MTHRFSRFRVADGKGRPILDGANMGKGLKMPDASKVLNEPCLDLMVAGQSWSVRSAETTNWAGSAWGLPSHGARRARRRADVFPNRVMQRFRD